MEWRSAGAPFPARLACTNPAQRRTEFAPSRPSRLNQCLQSRDSASTRMATVIHTTPTLPAMWLTACTIPCSTLMSLPHRDKQSERRPDVKRAGKHSAPRDRAGKDKFGSRISSPITEASSRPTRPKQITPKEFNTKRGSAGILKIGSGDRRAEARPNHHPEAYENGRSDERSDRAEIVDPLPNPKSDDVENGEQSEQRERRQSCKDLVVGEPQRDLGPST